MKKKAFEFFIVVAACWCLTITAEAATGNENPLKYISSCETDINGDGNLDIALLLENLTGRQLIVLLKTTNGHDGYVVAKDKPGMNLSCHLGKTLTRSMALSEDKKTYTTPGAYLELTLPEGSSVAYFWNGSGFTEVWTSD